jgi:23S rRNA (guanosine2251-2'-O)-methyltransferase
MATAKTHPDNDPFGGENPAGEVFWAWQCTSSNCGLRFPAQDGRVIQCPICRAPIVRLEQWQSSTSDRRFAVNSPARFLAVLDNIRSAYNVGSILRTSDGAGIGHAHLCGITPTPLHPRLAKTALTAEIHTSWSYHPDCVELIRSLKNKGITIIGLETSPGALDLTSEAMPILGDTALVVGNEICGIDPAVQVLCDHMYMLPMTGIKKSLNVSVSFGIAAYLLNRHRITELPVKSE